MKISFTIALTIAIVHISDICQAQTTHDNLSGSNNNILIVKGEVIDAETKKPLPWVTIGIPLKGVAVIANEEGKFSLTIPAKFKNETVLFTSVGYKDLKLPISTLEKNQTLTIAMEQMINELNEVVIKPREFGKTTILGSKKSNQNAFNSVTGEIPGYEAGMLINEDGKNCKILSVGVYIGSHYPRYDSFTYRMKIYKYDKINNKPSEQILESEYVFTNQTKDRGNWVDVPCDSLNIFIEEPVIISFECLNPQITEYPSYRITMPYFGIESVGFKNRNYYLRSGGLLEMESGNSPKWMIRAKVQCYK